MESGKNQSPTCLTLIEKHMKRGFLGALLLLFNCFPSICIGRSKEVSAEQQAYQNAVEFLSASDQAYEVNWAMAKSKQPAKMLQYPNPSIWDSNLKVLALSPSRQGSKYLAILAFFQVDGVGAEDFNCAASQRLETHKREFLKYLRQARDTYETSNPCLSHEFKEGRHSPVLQCITNDEYAKFVQIYESANTNDEDDSNCSHMFKPRTAKPK